ncbi:hypothetical protein TSUD_56690 [Trifolium subterraneum]|uniref:Retrovirus-related Pol polyprotein from transposon TNT 1-94 n=1 Tax=Trifolium subterraneum TaxID=3900 RepID=A0A2Z6NGL7_TRISU|nr:hypothetical protein TSUD_56690 [Trifolium subterraneum]
MLVGISRPIILAQRWGFFQSTWERNVHDSPRKRSSVRLISTVRRFPPGGISSIASTKRGFTVPSRRTIISSRRCAVVPWRGRAIVPPRMLPDRTQWPIRILSRCMSQGPRPRSRAVVFRSCPCRLMVLTNEAITTSIGAPSGTCGTTSGSSGAGSCYSGGTSSGVTCACVAVPSDVTDASKPSCWWCGGFWGLFSPMNWWFAPAIGREMGFFRCTVILSFVKSNATAGGCVPADTPTLKSVEGRRTLTNGQWDCACTLDHARRPRRGCPQRIGHFRPSPEQPEAPFYLTTGFSYRFRSSLSNNRSKLHKVCVFFACASMAESSNFMQPSIPRFDGHYDHWAMLMENLLRSKEYWSLIEEGIVTAPAGAMLEQLKVADESRLKDLKVKNFLFQAVDRTILEIILTRNTTKQIWDSMRQKYQGSTKVKRAQLQALKKYFEVLNMKIGESIEEYFSRTLAIANKMSAHGETMTQGTIVEKMLRSLTSRFNYVVCSIEQSYDVTTMSVDELQSSLLVQEQRMKNQKDEKQFLKLIGAFVFNEFFYLSSFMHGFILYNDTLYMLKVPLSSTPFLTDLDDMNLPLHWSSHHVFKHNGNILRRGLIRIVDVKIVVASECIQYGF